MKFYIRIVLLAAFLTSLLSAHAQSPTITWDSTVKDLGDSNYEVVFTGKILPGWHTYDLHSDVSSTLVEFEPATGLTLDGDPYEINASKREYDDIFEVEMGTYFDEIILGQKVTLTGEGAVLKGNINWRSCEEENCNSPEDSRSRSAIPRRPGHPLRPGTLRINLFPATEPESPKPCGG